MRKVEFLEFITRRSHPALSHYDLLLLTCCPFFSSTAAAATFCPFLPDQNNIVTFLPFPHLNAGAAAA